jgi:ribosomal subunit interface protein
MQIDITARNFTPSPKLKSFVISKISSLHKYDSNIQSSKVILLKEGRAQKVEILLKSNRNSYITKCYSSIFEKTISNAIDKIKVQIKKKQRD